MSKHYLIFIHGIGEHEDGDKSALGYEDLWKRLKDQSGMKPAEFDQAFGRIDVIWHVDPLQTAAVTLFNEAFPGLSSAKLDPMKGIRSFVTFFLGDAIAYVSEDVNFVRRTVWKKIWEYEDPATGQSFQELLQTGSTYSLIAHSLGTAIAFDYLFELFRRNTLFIPKLDAADHPVGDAFVDYSLDSNDITLLKDRFRHFFSMGSPIGLFLLRKGSLWYDIKNQFTTLYNPVRGQGRIWYNFWDRDDAIAYPLEQLFERNPENAECKLKDISVETGWLFKAHVNYWKSKKVAQEIMAVLTGKAG